MQFNLKLILVIFVVAIVVGMGSYFLFFSSSENLEDITCSDSCQKLSSICPTMVDYNDCITCCPQLKSEDQVKLQNVNSCEDFLSIEGLLSCGAVNENKVQKDCEPACTNYVSQCLIHVPNATQALFDEGFESCVEHCQDWDNEKIDCLAKANDCPSMTEVCGL